VKLKLCGGFLQLLVLLKKNVHVFIAAFTEINLKRHKVKHVFNKPTSFGAVLKRMMTGRTG
jgi:hypothetical protein